MKLQLHDRAPALAEGERLEYARQIIRAEAQALEAVASRLDDSFLAVVDLVFRSPGRVAVTGTGKSADVGQKIAGTLNSTGTRAYVLDATKAMHGDLGMVHPNDVALVLSHSGESDEIVRLLEPLRQLASAVVALTVKRKRATYRKFGGIYGKLMRSASSCHQISYDVAPPNFP